jgi:TetR/AcrR family transcriptional regulator, repressor of tetCD
VKRTKSDADQTRANLIEQSHRLFATKGYIGTSLDDVALHSNVTKGALYHHFSNKKDLFKACYTHQVVKLVSDLRNRPSIADPLQNAIQLGKDFLTYPKVVKTPLISIQEAISILGWNEWKELDAKFTMNLIEEHLTAVHPTLAPAEKARTSANLLYGTLVHGALVLADSPSKPATLKQILQMLEGLIKSIN